jgi:hypothetical protein
VCLAHPLLSAENAKTEPADREVGEATWRKRYVTEYRALEL